MVATNINQKFGYHKDTPFLIIDSKSGQAAMEINTNTKAIFSLEKNGKVMPNNPSNLASSVVPRKIFTKLCNAGTTLEN